MPHHPNPNPAEHDSLSFLYRFELVDGKTFEYRVQVDRKTLKSTCELQGGPPKWARLGAHCRTICHYQEGEYCPAALRLVVPVAIFADIASYTRAKVTVIAEERAYTKETDIQDGLRSLFGLLLATSGCPSMEDFQSMARFHLPFSTLEETSFRIAATLLLKRYFQARDGKTPSFDQEALADLHAVYAKVAAVNKGLAKQVTEAFQHESSVNAVIILDAFSVLVPMSVGDDLEGLRALLFGD